MHSFAIIAVVDVIVIAALSKFSLSVIIITIAVVFRVVCE